MAVYTNRDTEELEKLVAAFKLPVWEQLDSILKDNDPGTTMVLRKMNITACRQ